MKKVSFLSDGLSIDETKASVLVMAFAVLVGFAVYFYLRDGFVGDNLTTIVTTLIITIGGVNALKSMSKVFSTNDKLTKDKL